MFALDKVNNFKQTDKLPILKPKVQLATAKPTKQDRKQTTTTAPTTAGMNASKKWQMRPQKSFVGN